MPPGALTALVIFALLGVVLAVLERSKSKWVPSPTGIGIGMLVPAAVVIVMFLGGLLDWIWRRTSPESNARAMIPLASGLIAGEAIIAVLIPILIVLGVLR